MLHKPRAHRAQVFSAQEFHDDLLDDNGDDIDARISFHLHSRWTDATHIDPRSWVYGLHHIVGSVSGTIADGGVGKSSLVITESIAMATERNLLGVQPNGRQRGFCIGTARNPSTKSSGVSTRPASSTRSTPNC